MKNKCALRALTALFAMIGAVLVSSCAHSQSVIASGPIVGAVTDRTAAVTVRTSSDVTVAVEASTNPDFSGVVIRSSSLKTNANTDRFVRLDLAGLSPSTKYHLRPVIDGSVGSFAMERSFRTFPTSGRDTAFTFCFGSCEYQDGYRHSQVWQLMKKVDPLLFLQIGDWTYPDQQISPIFGVSDSLQAVSYENKYSKSHPVDSFLASRAVDYVYDDHDFAGDNTDGTNPARSHSIEAYKSYFPHYTLPNDSDGIWHTFMVGNVQFFVLDLRSVRSPNMEAITNTNGSYGFAPQAGHSILRGLHRSGVDQLSWLETALKESPARWKVVMSSVSWNPAMKNFVQLGVLYANLKKDPSKLIAAVDSWVGFPEDQDSLLAFIKREQIANVMVCSGDVHTGMMDDGTHSVFPEIVAANLEIPNSNLYGELDSLGLAAQLWDKGGQVHDTTNCYGRVSVLTSPFNMLQMEVVNERDSVVARYLMPDATSKGSVMGMTAHMSNGVKVLSQNNGNLLLQVSFEHEVPVKFYIADESGREVRLLTQGTFQPGTVRFRLTPSSFTSGTYFAILETEGRVWKDTFTITK